MGTLGVGGFFLRPNFLGHVEGCPGLGPARVKSGMGQDLGNLGSRDAVLFGGGEVITKGRVHQPLRHQRRNRHQGAVAQG